MTKVGSLDELVELLRVEFDEREKRVVDLERVRSLLLAYKSCEADWRRFAKFDRFKYTRNLVDVGNGRYNLIVLCWGEGHASAIHDHADSHCFMKMLKGQLDEVRYEWPEDSPSDATTTMTVTGRTRLHTDEVCYINDSIGLHRVENPSNSSTAVSLHLYMPPFDACHVFNHQTGHKTRVPITFWSKFGESRDREIQDARQPEDV